MKRVFKVYSYNYLTKKNDRNIIYFNYFISNRILQI